MSSSGFETDVSSRWYELIGTGAQRWRSSLRQLAPDVVVVVYGSAECQPNVVPTTAKVVEQVVSRVVSRRCIAGPRVGVAEMTVRVDDGRHHGSALEVDDGCVVRFA